jgi:hypothetical protein
VFNHGVFFANLQSDASAATTRFTLENATLWKPMDPLAITNLFRFEFSPDAQGQDR